jgi:hypothetical protein
MAPIYKRRFLAGSSLNEAAAEVSPPAVEPPVAVAEQPAPLPVPKKTGRPKKHASDSVRMSANYLQKTEAERKQLVANIMWRVRSAVSKPLGPADGRSANKYAAMMVNNAKWLSDFRNKLLTLTIMPLKRFYRLLIGLTDGTGRLPGERSGETPQAGGMSEIERILNLVVSGVEDDVVEQERERSTPVPFLVEDNPKRAKKELPLEPERVEQLLESAIVKVSDEWWGDPDDDRPRVSEDGTIFTSVYPYRTRLREDFRDGEKQVALKDTLRSLLGGEQMADDAQKSLDNNLNYARILFVMKAEWMERKAKERKDRRWNRKAKKAGRTAREEQLMQKEEQSAAEGWTMEEKTKPVGENRRGKKDRPENGLG